MNVKVDGERLRDIRRRSGMERRELAEKSAVHWTTIARLELGQDSMRISTARRLAEALGVDHSEFVGKEVVVGNAARSPS